MNRYDTIIIGAGPAGLFAAARILAQPGQVLVLEKQPEPGRKLLLTGSGQCNFTHTGPILDFLNHYGEHGAFLKPALLNFTNKDIIAFFQKQGVESMTVPKTGKVFPCSLRARDILNALLSACRESKAEIRCQHPVGSIRLLAPQHFEIISDTREYHAHRVMIATGGTSYPATGSTGDGWQLAQSLGHSLIPARPGLAPFIIKNHPLAGLTGISFTNLSVTLWRQDRKIKTLSGDLVLTHFGVSGPVVHNLARYALPGDTATLAFLSIGDNDLATFRKEWLAALERSGKLRIKAWLKSQSLPQALVDTLLALAQVPPETAVARLHQRQRLELMRLATAFPLVIEAIGDWNSAMVTCGGVALPEVNPKTMESRLVKGLYFAGEVLDIDGDSGGYDLQAAWSTAALVAAHVNENPVSSTF